MNEIQVKAFNVGQGNCTIITLNKQVWIFDCGTTQLPTLEAFDFKNEPMKDKAQLVEILANEISSFKHLHILVSHPDMDHCNLIQLLVKPLFKTRKSDITFYHDPNYNLAMYKVTLPLSTELIMGEDKWTVNGKRTKKDSFVEILNKRPLQHWRNKNSNSIVVRVSYGEFSILLTGDANNETYKSISKDRKANIFQVSHHGSATEDSTTLELLEQVQPDYIFISSHLFSRFGHPSISTINKIISYFNPVIPAQKEEDEPLNKAPTKKLKQHKDPAKMFDKKAISNNKSPTNKEQISVEKKKTFEIKENIFFLQEFILSDSILPENIYFGPIVSLQQKEKKRFGSIYQTGYPLFTTGNHGTIGFFWNNQSRKLKTIFYNYEQNEKKKELSISEVQKTTTNLLPELYKFSFDIVQFIAVTLNITENKWSILETQKNLEVIALLVQKKHIPQDKKDAIVKLAEYRNLLKIIFVTKNTPNFQEKPSEILSEIIEKRLVDVRFIPSPKDK